MSSGKGGLVERNLGFRKKVEAPLGTREHCPFEQEKALQLGLGKDGGGEIYFRVLRISSENIKSTGNPLFFSLATIFCRSSLDLF